MADFSIIGLRILREVAARGSFSAAARALGYTQSAVSRQVATLEMTAGHRLFERRQDGVRLTPTGSRLLRRATTVLAELDVARRELQGVEIGDGPVRLGAFSSAGAVLVPAALGTLARQRPELDVTLREGTTPALVRALRAGTIDLAVMAMSPPFRPLDAESPAFAVETISQTELLLAVGADHPFAGRGAVELEELEDQRWIASRSDADEALLGVWPGLAGRPHIAYTVRDWLAKLGLVAAGLGITSLPAILAGALPPGVEVVGVRGEPHEQRRIVLVRSSSSVLAGDVDAVADALRAAVPGALGLPRR